MSKIKVIEIEVIEPAAYLITPVEVLLKAPQLVELMGRVCYKSEDRISPDSATRFIRNIIKRGHDSVIEHFSVSYKFICSRTSSHQMVRHRLASFSQESMRYVDYSKSGKLQVIVPPSIQGEAREAFLTSCERSYKEYLALREKGVKPEDARFLLPHASKTEIVVSANLREWRHIIKMRALNKHAQWEIRKLLIDVLYELHHYIPAFFDDLVQQLS